MAQEEQQQAQQPKNIFELINQNVVDLSQDVVALYRMMQTTAAKVDAIYTALYPSFPNDAPNDLGAEDGSEIKQ